MLSTLTLFIAIQFVPQYRTAKPNTTVSAIKAPTRQPTRLPTYDSDIILSAIECKTEFCESWNNAAIYDNYLYVFNDYQWKRDLEDSAADWVRGDPLPFNFDTGSYSSPNANFQIRSTFAAINRGIGGELESEYTYAHNMFVYDITTNTVTEETFGKKWPLPRFKSIYSCVTYNPKTAIIYSIMGADVTSGFIG